MSLVKRNTRFGFPSLLDDLFMNDRLDVWGGQRTQVPAANIKETENDFQVALAAPIKSCSTETALCSAIFNPSSS